MALLVITSIVVVVAAIVIYNAVFLRRQALQLAEEVTLAKGNIYANSIKTNLELSLKTARTLAQTFSAVKDNYNPLQINRKQANSILQKVLLSNEFFLGVTSVWDPNAFDNDDEEYVNQKGHDATGRFMPYWRRSFTGGTVVEPAVNYEVAGKSNYYLIPKKKLQEAIVGPFIYNIESEDVQVIALSSPIVSDKKFFGVVAVDITINWIQQMIEADYSYDGEMHITVISNNGTIVADSHRSELVGKFIREVHTNWDIEMQLIQGGETYIGDSRRLNKIEVLVPVHIGDTETPWSVKISVPKNVAEKDTVLQMWIFISIAIILTIAAILLILNVQYRLVNPLHDIAKVTRQLATGNIEQTERIRTTGSEFKRIHKAFYKLTKNLQQTADFATEIGKGNLNAEFTPSSEKDRLGNSLLNMRVSLKAAKDDELKRAEEDEKRNWANRGIARFNEILRQRTDNIKELSYNVISNLVEYLEANQGGVYLLTDDKKQVELTAAFAFSKRKYDDRKLPANEGLIGASLYEKATILLTDLPEEYIEVTSGLGDATPNCLLIVPLKHEEQILGVVELATFHTFQKHEIEFVEEIANGIASTLSAARINEKTSTLLRQSKIQSEEMAAKEEEMRTNLEELQYIQTQADNNNAQYKSLLRAISQSTYFAEYDLDGKLIDINDNFLKLFDLERERLIGRFHKNLVRMETDDYNAFWNNILNDKVERHEMNYRIRGKDIWLDETFAPIQNSENKIVKIMSIGFDTTRLH